MKNFLLSFFMTMFLCLPMINANDLNTTKEISFNFTTTSGEKIEVIDIATGLKFPSLKDKNVITMFYIYSGKPCRNELKLFSKIKTKYSDLEFVTFELKGLSPKELKDFKKELNLEGLHMIDKEQALSFASYIASRTGWKGPVPLLIVTDKKGAVKHTQLGAMNEEEINTLLKKL